MSDASAVAQSPLTTSAASHPVSNTMVFDAVVFGAGVSGLVATSVLLAQGAHSVLVVDEYPRVGGNHLDVALGDYTFDVGSFIFQDDSPLLEHFPELLPLYQPIDPSWARVNPQGMVTEYPFSARDDILAAGPVEILRMALSAVVGRLDRRPMRTARDFARRWLGSRFLRHSGLENYMERFCGCPIDQIDLDFAQSRMMWISEHSRLPALLRRALSRGSRTPPPARTNTQLARPREGFASLYAPAQRGLEDRGATFVLGTRIGSLQRDGSSFEVRTSTGVFRAQRVFATIPLSRAAEICGLACERPPTVTLISLFYSFAGQRGFDASILYNFTYDARWKRLTVYSDFYGTAGGRSYFTVEVVADDAATAAEADAEFRAHTEAHGLFEGELRLEGSHILTNAYPIYTDGSTAKAKRIIAELKEFGVESFGRQGAFRYQPTARVSTHEAEAAVRSATGVAVSSSSSEAA